MTLRLCERECEWPYDQTSRRCAECKVEDVDLDDLVLDVVVVEVDVLLRGTAGCCVGVCKDVNMARTDVDDFLTRRK